MSQDDIRRRFEQYQLKKREVDASEKHRQRAMHGRHQMIAALKQALRENVGISNNMFQSVPHGQCDVVQDRADLFTIRRLRTEWERVLQLAYASGTLAIEAKLFERGRHSATRMQQDRTLRVVNLEIGAELAGDGYFYLLCDTGTTFPETGSDELAMYLLEGLLPGASDLDG